MEKTRSLPQPEVSELQAAPLGKRQIAALKTRQKIFQAGIRLFIQKGYNNVTIDDIVTAAKVAKGSFYNHFSAKEELIFEVYDDYDLRYQQAYQSAIESGQPYALRQFFRNYFSSIRRSRDMEILRTMYSIQVYAENPRDISQPSRPLHDYVRKLIGLGKANGEICSDIDDDRLLTHLVNYVVGVEYNWSLNNGRYDLVAEAMSEFDLLLRGLAASAGD